MKDIDETPPPKSESEQLFEQIGLIHDRVHRLLERIQELEKQVANLEARKPPQDTNPDPEWFS